MGELPVLFLPGTLCTPDVFKSQIGILATHAPRIEAVRFTTQDSIAAMAEEAIGHLPPADDVAIVGFSMGGMVAMEICRRLPSRVAKLALLNTNHHADLPERKAGRDLQLEQARLLGLEQVLRQHYLPNCLHKPSKAAEDLIVAMAVELGVDCLAAQSRALATRVDSTATLERVSCPTLILGGKQDRLCDADTQYRVHRLIEDSELRLLDDCGHFSTLEQPHEVNAALRDWYLKV